MVSLSRALTTSFRDSLVDAAMGYTAGGAEGDHVISHTIMLRTYELFMTCYIQAGVIEYVISTPTVSNLRCLGATLSQCVHGLRGQLGHTAFLRGMRL